MFRTPIAPPRSKTRPRSNAHEHAIVTIDQDEPTVDNGIQRMPLPSRQWTLDRPADSTPRSLLTTGSLKCSECGRVKATEEDMKGHISENHLDYCPFRCGRCDLSFSTLSEFMRHFYQAHPGWSFEYSTNLDPSKQTQLNSILLRSLSTMNRSAAAVSEINEQPISISFEDFRQSVKTPVIPSPKRSPGFALKFPFRRSQALAPVQTVQLTIEAGSSQTQPSSSPSASVFSNAPETPTVLQEIADSSSTNLPHGPLKSSSTKSKAADQSQCSKCHRRCKESRRRQHVLQHLKKERQADGGLREIGKSALFLQTFEECFPLADQSVQRFDEPALALQQSSSIDSPTVIGKAAPLVVNQRPSTLQEPEDKEKRKVKGGKKISSSYANEHVNNNHSHINSISSPAPESPTKPSRTSNRKKARSEKQSVLARKVILVLTPVKTIDSPNATSTPFPRTEEQSTKPASKHIEVDGLEDTMEDGASTTNQEKASTVANSRKRSKLSFAPSEPDGEVRDTEVDELSEATPETPPSKKSRLSDSATPISGKRECALCNHPVSNATVHVWSKHVGSHRYACPHCPNFVAKATKPPVTKHMKSAHPFEDQTVSDRCDQLQPQFDVNFVKCFPKYDEKQMEEAANVTNDGVQQTPHGNDVPDLSAKDTTKRKCRLCKRRVEDGKLRGHIDRRHPGALPTDCFPNFVDGDPSAQQLTDEAGKKTPSNDLKCKLCEMMVSLKNAQDHVEQNHNGVCEDNVSSLLAQCFPAHYPALAQPDATPDEPRESKEPTPLLFDAADTTATKEERETTACNLCPKKRELPLKEAANHVKKRHGDAIERSSLDLVLAHCFPDHYSASKTQPDQKATEPSDIPLKEVMEVVDDRPDVASSKSTEVFASGGEEKIKCKKCSKKMKLAYIAAHFTKRHELEGHSLDACFPEHAQQLSAELCAPEMKLNKDMADSITSIPATDTTDAHTKSTIAYEQSFIASTRSALIHRLLIDYSPNFDSCLLDATISADECVDSQPGGIDSIATNAGHFSIGSESRFSMSVSGSSDTNDQMCEEMDDADSETSSDDQFVVSEIVESMLDEVCLLDTYYELLQEYWPGDGTTVM